MATPAGDEEEAVYSEDGRCELVCDAFSAAGAVSLAKQWWWKCNAQCVPAKVTGKGEQVWSPAMRG